MASGGEATVMVVGVAIIIKHWEKKHRWQVSKLADEDDKICFVLRHGPEM